MDFRHRLRRSIWTASLSEDVTTTRSRQLAFEPVPLLDAFGNPVVDPNGQAVVIESPTDNETLTDETFVATAFRTSYAYQGDRTNYSLSLTATNRETQVTNSSTNVYGLSANASHRLSRRTTASWRGSVQESDSGRSNSTRLSTSVRLVHNLARNATGSIDYRHQENSSDVAGNEFTENRFSVGLQLRF